MEETIPAPNRRAAGPRTSLIAAVLVVVLALASVDVVVLLAVQPQLEGLRDIGERPCQRRPDHDADPRSHLGSAPELVNCKMTWRTQRPPRRTASREFVRLREDARSVLLLAGTPAQRSDVEALDAALGRCADESFSIGRLIAGGEHAAAREQAESLTELVRRAEDESSR